MAKSKDRLMLEELFKAASENNLYEDSCGEGRELLKNLAKHLNKPLSDICGEPVVIGLSIDLEEFVIDDVFDADDLATYPSDEFEVEVIVKRNGKRIQVDVSNIDWR